MKGPAVQSAPWWPQSPPGGHLGGGLCSPGGSGACVCVCVCVCCVCVCVCVCVCAVVSVCVCVHAEMPFTQPNTAVLQQVAEMVKHSLLVLPADSTEVAEKTAAAGHHLWESDLLRRERKRNTF